MSHIQWTIKKARKIIISIVGMTVLLIGIAMIVLPGPAVIVIPIGLGILATEYVWARNLLHKVKERFPKMAAAVQGKTKPEKPEPESNK